MKNDRAWGQDAVYPVHWDRITSAAKHAVLDPVTWVSAGGAALFAIDDFDQKVSRWAVQKTPIFGSPANARDDSGLFVDILKVEAYGTILLTPSGDDPWVWTYSKAKGLGVEYLAMEATSRTTELIKESTDRLRPDESDRRSFPSGHASSAFSSARLANRNLDSIDMNPRIRTPLKAGNLVLASGAAWARVEGQKHFPSDVLVGACLGNMVTTFIHDAFMNLPGDEEEAFGFYVEPSPRGVVGMISWSF